MQLQVHRQLAEIPKEAWNQLLGADMPFLRHEFLHALETTKCVSADTGWLPQHLALYAEKNNKKTLLGAVPAYIKNHSYGEYIFDWAWANAYERAGLSYYPKLSVAIPFTPVTGNRILVAQDQDKQEIARRLIAGALELSRQHKVSSLHWLFAKPDEVAQLQNFQHLSRTGYQFHWKNQEYRDFDHFLEDFSSQKRKKVRRERRQVKEAGIELEVITGEQLNDAHLRTFYQFYRSTVRNHGAIPYLNWDFFHEIGQTMAESIVIIFARKNNDTIAGSLNFKDHNNLYGRYWGCSADYHSLHFETCYYRAIEYCIDHNIQKFEAGAQGEHKLSRGFLPTEVYSSHWLDHPEFYGAVADFLEREKNGIDFQINELNDHSPFKQIC